jgi:hypothetical protein
MREKEKNNVDNKEKIYSSVLMFLDILGPKWKKRKRHNNVSEKQASSYGVFSK